MTPELEVLDQLLGGDLPLEVVARLFNDHQRLGQALLRMIEAGEVTLIDSGGAAISPWRFQELQRAGGLESAAPSIRVAITKQGAKRIA